MVSTCPLSIYLEPAEDALRSYWTYKYMKLSSGTIFFLFIFFSIFRLLLLVLKFSSLSYSFSSQHTTISVYLWIMRRRTEPSCALR